MYDNMARYLRLAYYLPAEREAGWSFDTLPLSVFFSLEWPDKESAEIKQEPQEHSTMHGEATAAISKKWQKAS
ncbi:hypothetical protein EYC84_004965 [Monilinia fructicola]|uniref:Uncharacterized protein n=1 Tax=Monilinia fructicola TaxID=38448 RepID=A0A5M9K5Y1_MONFR|nr:hypothetical protein EYC84_004965 [Monilinia fructicola]